MSVQENRRHVFELENKVLANKALLYATRAQINENSSSIRRNYDAAFIGNRQLANQNTDDIFRNRLAIVRNIDAKSDLQTQYRAALENKARLEFLEHRSKLNERALKVSERLAAANKTAIDINRDVIDNNEQIVQTNSKLIAENARLLAEGVDVSKVTKQELDTLVAQNKERIDTIAKRAGDNSQKLQEVFDAASANRTSIQTNSNSIAARRTEILSNQRKIRENQAKVSSFIASKL